MTNVMGAALVLALGVTLSAVVAAPAWTQSAPPQTPSPSGAKVYFINLNNGQEMPDIIISWSTSL